MHLDCERMSRKPSSHSKIPPQMQTIDVIALRSFSPVSISLEGLSLLSTKPCTLILLYPVSV